VRRIDVFINFAADDPAALNDERIGNPKPAIELQRYLAAKEGS
jgi:hypothetical protein